MVAGNPLWVFEFEWPCSDRYLLVRMQDMSWGVGQVDVQDDRRTCVTRLLCVFDDLMLCSDGRKGIVIDTRDESGVSGGGTLQLNDGTTGSFIFGAAAGKL